MFKACIVTVYNSINSGSFWQAYVLGKVLEKFDYKVQYLKRYGDSTSSNTVKALIKRIGKSVLYNGVRCGVNAVKQYVEFVKCWRQFSLCTPKNWADIDCFVLGSDTIWNLEDKYFLNNRKRYFGGEFENRFVFSYAASIANTSRETISKYPEILKYLKKLISISVRDRYSREIISEIIPKEIFLTCDPTLLWTVDDYFPLIGKNPGYKYIFLYLFTNLTEDQNKNLKKFAHENKLLLINGVNKANKTDLQVDLQIVNSPLEFLRYLYFAEYVVTDTYHGTIFSTNFEKQFIVINHGKNKVNDFMDFIQLSDRIIEDSNFSEYFSHKIQFERVTPILNQFRNESLSYIKNVLEKNKNECTA